MIRNYIITALRNILKNKLFSFLNIFGLALGMTATILILLWVQDELSYDKYNDDYNLIYRINERFMENESEQNFAVVPFLLGETLINDYPEVTKICRFRDVGYQMIKVSEESFEANAIWSDSTFFNFFTIPLIIGDKYTVLNGPNNVTISQKIALKYFGEKDPIGEILEHNDTEYTITGVYEDIPQNSHFHFDIIFPLISWYDPGKQSWGSNNYLTYFKIQANADIESFSEKFKEVIRKYIAPLYVQYRGGTIEEYLEESTLSFPIQPLKDIHLKSDLIAELEANSDEKNVYLFSIVAIVILVIGCINFMNLSTARSGKRSMEIGIRKVSGASKTHIIRQHILEAFIMAIISYILAMILVELFLPAFNSHTGKSIFIDYTNLSTFIKLLSICIITGILAGSYPSFYLSSFKPTIVLSGGSISGRGSQRLRNILVIIQFMASIILISFSIIIFQQLNFINKTDIGYDRHDVIYINNSYLLGGLEKSRIYRDEMLKNPQILSGSMSNFLPIHLGTSNRMGARPDGDRDKSTALQQWYIHDDYIKTMKMELVAGRDFSKELITDSTAIIINEAAVKQFGWKNPLDHYLFLSNDDSTEYRVIGVVKDFNFQSITTKIQPLLFRLNQYGHYIFFRYNHDNKQELIKMFRDKWEQMAPNEPFMYEFFDVTFNSIYEKEKRTGDIMLVFTILAIIVASLGLLGLTIFLAEKRSKEVGIRKVNGASILSIFVLFSKNVSKLVLIAFILAVPPSWYFINSWLNNFVYRIDIDWKIFVISALLSMCLAIITILYQTVKAARMNPADSLRHE